MAYTVSQRVTEIAVRMAMGATLGHVVGMVVRQGAKLAAVGICAGLIGAVAVAAARAVQSPLFVDARGLGPVTFAAAALLLTASALAATYIPARRAARISASTALTR